MALNPLAVAVLALLTERSMHPYEMYGLLLNRREDEQLKLSPGSLYRSVERLADNGLVVPVGTEREGNRPERTTYAITEHGTDAMRTRLMEMLRTPAQEYPTFPFAIGEAHNLEPDVVVQLLTSYRAQLDGRLVELDSALSYAAERSVSEAYMINVDYLRATVTAQRDWIAALISRITTKDLSWPTS